MRIIIEQGGLSPETDEGFGYTELKSLSFAPETGILGQSAPINAFTADIITPDDIAAGDYMRLRDDTEALWAQYWLTAARRVDKKTVRVTGQSDLLLLDRPTLPATFYNGVTAADIVKEIFDSVGYDFSGAPYTLDPAIAAEALTGFCPEQTARERLQRVCFAAGAYIKTWFCRNVQILPIPEMTTGDFGTLIPIGQTFYKPTITQTDYVTAVTVKAYSFTPADPQSGESYVTAAGGETYVYTVEDITIQNPDIQPAQFPVNVVSAQDVMLLDRARASAVASALAQYYFKRTTVTVDVIDNGAYQPGQKVTVYVDEDRLYTGYITSCAFRFGTQARATLTVGAAEQNDAARLTVNAVYNGAILATRRYSFPVGYGYSFNNDYIDQTVGGVRRVYRPLEALTEGAMPADGAEVTVNYDVALENQNGVLTVISVDSVTEETEDDIRIGVIT